jgi:hypothetical protein
LFQELKEELEESFKGNGTEESIEENGTPPVRPDEEHSIFGEYIGQIIKNQNEKSKTEKLKLNEIIFVVGS